MGEQARLFVVIWTAVVIVSVKFGEKNKPQLFRTATMTSPHVNVVSACVQMTSLPRSSGLVTAGWDGFIVQWDYGKRKDLQMISTGR